MTKTTIATRCRTYCQRQLTRSSSSITTHRRRDQKLESNVACLDRAAIDDLATASRTALQTLRLCRQRRQSPHSALRHRNNNSNHNRIQQQRARRRKNRQRNLRSRSLTACLRRRPRLRRSTQWRIGRHLYRRLCRHLQRCAIAVLSTRSFRGFVDVPIRVALLRQSRLVISINFLHLISIVSVIFFLFVQQVESSVATS